MENSNAACMNSSEEFHETVFTIKMATSFISCFMNIIALLIMLAGGSYRKLFFRLIIYLLLADLLLVIVQILELTPVTYENGHVQVRDGESWYRICSIFGFFDQLTAWMRNLVVIIIVIYLCVMIKHPEPYHQEQSKRSKILEAVGVCICVFLPITFNWIPFIHDYYGLSGHWCWIKLTEEGCGQGNVTEGALYMLFLYYVPLLVIIALTSFICVVLLYVVCCKNGSRDCKILLLVLYTIVFDILCFVMTLNRVMSAVHSRKNSQVSFALWILHSFADSGRTILPSLAVILSLICAGSRKMLCPESRDEEKPLIHPKV